MKKCFLFAVIFALILLNLTEAGRYRVKGVR